MDQPGELEELKAGWRALAGGQGEGWRTIEIGRHGPCKLRAGRLYPGDHEALLVGFSPTCIPAAAMLPIGHGFAVTRVDIGAGGSLAWLALARVGSASPDLFIAMTADVLQFLSRAAGSDEEVRVRAFLSRVAAWQDFMERGSSPVLGPEAELGLVGELLVLEALLERDIEARVAVEAWKGPLRGIRDFILGTGAIEVKTSTSVGEFPARIASLEQLDDSTVNPVFIAAIRVQAGPTGRSLPMIAEQVEDRLEGTRWIAEAYRERLVRAGYLVAYADRYLRQFGPLESRYIQLSAHFPRLVRANVPAAVSSAKYFLNLDMVEGESVPLEQVLHRLGVT